MNWCEERRERGIDVTGGRRGVDARGERERGLWVCVRGGMEEWVGVRGGECNYACTLGVADR